MRFMYMWTRGAVAIEPYPLYDENNILTPSGEMEARKEAHGTSELPTKGTQNAMRNHENLSHFCTHDLCLVRPVFLAFVSVIAL